MKRALSIINTLSLVLISHLALSQYNIVWEKTFGGTQQDSGHKIQNTQDGGFIVSGFTNSNDLDVTEHYGNGDYWVVKLDSIGKLIWEKNYGGSGSETGCDIIEVSGGYLIAANSRSIDNDVSNNNGESDIWIARIDQSGNLEWEKNYGGSEQDIFKSIVQTSDKGFLLTTYTRSNDGDLNSSVQGNDYWVVKLDELGDIEWQQNYGGSKSDFASKGIETLDNNYLILGRSLSNDGDVPSNNGESDIWLIKLNRNGDIVWSKVYGSDESEVATSISELDDGNLIIVGWKDATNSTIETDTDDILILKIDSNGNLIWTKTYGGNGKDLAFDITTNENELIVISRTNSDDLEQSFGSDDIMLISTDLDGNVNSTLSFGGSELDRPLSLESINDTSVIVTGLTYSSDMDISLNKGESDVWVVKLSRQSMIDNGNNENEESNTNQTPCEVILYPNPTSNRIDFLQKELIAGEQLRIHDVTGKLVLEKIIEDKSVDISELISGHYLLHITNTDCKYEKQLIITKD